VRVADEDRRHDELKLVDEVTGQKLRVHVAAALHHQPPDAAIREVGAQPLHLDAASGG
jgi:hypothetical protein